MVAPGRMVRPAMSDTPNPGSPAVVRSGPEERAYLLRRAEDHRKLAERTTDTETRMVHLRLRQLCEDRAAGIGVVLTD